MITPQNFSASAYVLFSPNSHLRHRRAELAMAFAAEIGSSLPPLVEREEAVQFIAANRLSQLLPRRHGESFGLAAQQVAVRGEHLREEAQKRASQHIPVFVTHDHVGAVLNVLAEAVEKAAQRIGVAMAHSRPPPVFAQCEAARVDCPARFQLRDDRNESEGIASS